MPTRGSKPAAPAAAASSPSTNGQPALEIPAGLAATIASVYGERGREWLAAAPALVAEAAARRGIALGDPYPNLTYNFVAEATLRDGTPAVLKVGVPAKEILGEIEALRLFGGRGAVRLLEADPRGALLLLERVMPGTTLDHLDDDDEETRIAAAVMQRLWTPAPAEHELTTLAELFGAFDRLRSRHNGEAGPIPADLLERSETLVADLLRTAPSPVVLHGDFHHHNVLLGAGGEWRVIDPPGAIGDPAAEPGMFLCNPHDRINATDDLAALMARRIAIFAEALGLERDRIIGWGVAWATMSACWHDEDNTGGEAYAVRCARAIEALL